MGKAEGTFECPICGWPEPHSHSAEEIAQRPAIDGARMAFEKLGRKFIAEHNWNYFRNTMTGYWWGYEGERARSEDGNAYGWARRDSWTGRYTHDFTQIMWMFWRAAWMAARTEWLSSEATQDE